jgi:hypothetical protein
VDVDRDHQPERERPAEGRPVHAEEGEHRHQRRQLRQAEERELELGDEQNDEAHGTRGPAFPLSAAGLRLLATGREKSRVECFNAGGDCRVLP